VREAFARHTNPALEDDLPQTVEVVLSRLAEQKVGVEYVVEDFGSAIPGTARDRDTQTAAIMEELGWRSH
jgi:hypothetical protein